MGHSYTNLLVHMVFSTKERRPFLTPELRERLFPYLGGIARAKKMNALAVGGVEDHVHVLLSMPSTMTIADAARGLKASSSKWIRETFAEMADFHWQQGYGAFSIGVSQLEKTKEYINTQAEHHQRNSFQEELVSFLEAHGIDYDRRYLLG